jgi:hypothetical protein
MAEYFNYYTKIRSIKHIGFELQIIFDWGILGTVFIIYFIINGQSSNLFFKNIRFLKFQSIYKEMNVII